MPTIEAKVASILDSRRVALNAGENSGVKVGASVTLWRTVTVKDPDSGEVLGNVRIDAMDLEVVSVEERLSIATPKSSSNLVFNFIASRPRIRNSESRRGSPPGGADDVTVEIGDEVSIQALASE